MIKEKLINLVEYLKNDNIIVEQESSEENHMFNNLSDDYKKAFKDYKKFFKLYEQHVDEDGNAITLMHFLGKEFTINELQDLRSLNFESIEGSARINGGIVLKFIINARGNHDYSLRGNLNYSF